MLSRNPKSNIIQWWLKVSINFNSGLNQLSLRAQLTFIEVSINFSWGLNQLWFKVSINFNWGLNQIWFKVSIKIWLKVSINHDFSICSQSFLSISKNYHRFWLEPIVSKKNPPKSSYREGFWVCWVSPQKKSLLLEVVGKKQALKILHSGGILARILQKEGFLHRFPFSSGESLAQRSGCEGTI